METFGHKSKRSVEQKETREEYWKRIDKAIDDVKNNRNLVKFSGEEIMVFSEKLPLKESASPNH